LRPDGARGDLVARHTSLRRKRRKHEGFLGLRLRLVSGAPAHNPASRKGNPPEPAARAKGGRGGPPPLARAAGSVPDSPQSYNSPWFRSGRFRVPVGPASRAGPEAPRASRLGSSVANGRSRSARGTHELLPSVGPDRLSPRAAPGRQPLSRVEGPCCGSHFLQRAFRDGTSRTGGLDAKKFREKMLASGHFPATISPDS